jgi:hypothetical protein
MASIPSPLISLFILLQLQNYSIADEIVLKLRNSAEQPVQGRVEMQVPNEKKAVWIVVATTADARLPDAKCSPPGIVFRALPYDQTYFLETSEMMKSCVIGEIVFRFKRKDYAALIEEALSDQSDALISASTDTKYLYNLMTNALEKSNFADAATRSMLLHDAIEKELGREAAEPYRVLATDLGASPITSTKPLMFDPKQKRYVMSPDTVKAVAEFQKKQGLSADGNLTWGTVEKLPNFGGVYVGMTVK